MRSRCSIEAPGTVQGVCAGPVESAFGVYLIPILDNLPARMPPLEEVHDAVLKGRRAAKALEIRE